MGKMRKRKGFTLIEILISVAILLALTFIGAFKFINVVEENNVKIDVINAKTIADGINMAMLSGVTVSDNPSGSALTNPSELSKFFDTTVKPKSKKYGKDKGSYTYSIKEQEIYIYAGGQQLYPLIAETS